MVNTNIAPMSGVYQGIKTFTAEEAISRYYVVKVGATTPTTDYIQKGDSATEIPLGIALDEAEASGDPVAVAVLGSCPGPLPAIAAAAITTGATIQSNGDGKVKTLVSTFMIGRAIRGASGDGDVIEFTPCVPPDVAKS